MIKELNYTKEFGKRLAQKRDRMGFPRNVIFELTHRCNLRCRHCYIVPKSERRELSTSQVKSIFEQLVEAGCFHLTLTGGEPMVREDILSLMEYARKIGLFIHLFTNATLVTFQIADRLKEFQLISLEVSLHSLKKERFDWFTQVAGSFDLVMRAIKFLKGRGIKLALKINITKVNLDEIEELKGFVKDLEAIPEWATIITPRSDASKDNLFLRLEPEEVLRVSDILLPESIDEEEALLAGVREDKESRRNRARNKLFQCWVAKKGLAISPYGELKLCSGFPSSGYFILDGSLKEGWEMLGNYIESFKPSPEYKCFDCKLRDFCSSCPAQAMLECGDMNGCPDYYRRLAELSAKD
jgi:radical SAM protein with 4Fe4S-binding SPASM domain